MALTKKDAPANTDALKNDANPTGDPAANTGPVGTPGVIDAQEHVLGDDPRRVEAQMGGYHDSLSGRPINKDGYFTDGMTTGDEPVEEHRRVANNWPEVQEHINDPAKREGNTAA